MLVGPMGAGKSSIGRRVAKALGARFVDTDTVVIAAHGQIEEIFAQQGEAAFRQYERAAVAEALAHPDVVSLGGGAVIDPDTRADLAACDVVLLTVDPHVVAERIAGSTRPLLAGEDPAARWERIYRDRRPFYEEVADVTFDTSSGPLQNVVQAIVAWANPATAAPQENS